MIKINKWKIIAFIFILLFSIYKIIDNKNLNIKDNVYIVSQSENFEKETISNNISDEKYNSVKEDIKIENTNKNKKTITVFISGEVKNPGVVTIDIDKRLSDAIDKLGGITENADLNKINLAIKLEDESHYIIPKIGENLESNNEHFENDTVYDSNDNNLININTANVQELDSLPGVGEATANKIVKYREEKGKFNSIEEIKNVNGIGDKKYEELKALISIE